VGRDKGTVVAVGVKTTVGLMVGEATLAQAARATPMKAKKIKSGKEGTEWIM